MSTIVKIINAAVVDKKVIHIKSCCLNFTVPFLIVCLFLLVVICFNTASAQSIGSEITYLTH